MDTWKGENPLKYCIDYILSKQKGIGGKERWMLCFFTVLDQNKINVFHVISQHCHLRKYSKHECLSVKSDCSSACTRILSIIYVGSCSSKETSDQKFIHLHCACVGLGHGQYIFSLWKKTFVLLLCLDLFQDCKSQAHIEKIGPNDHHVEKPLIGIGSETEPFSSY